MLKKKTSTKIDEAVAKSVNFEITVADLARRSERRAWWVAFSAIGMSLILAGGYFYMLPLKEKVPFVVMADAYTGTSTVARLTDDFNNKRITTSEAINRSNIAHFVLARESYDSAMINLRDWATVQTMSASSVASAYTELYSPRNEASPSKIYGRNRAVRVKILSIVLLGGGPDTPPKGATVRFQRSVYDKQTGATVPLDSKIATISFTYKTNLRMDEQYRIENPLGFQVTEYRVDSDYATAPPDEVPATGDESAAHQPGTGAPASSSSVGEALQPGVIPPPPTIPESNQEPSAPRQTPATSPRTNPNGGRG
ncbi:MULTISPECIES: type IV secretion system protein [unclassified Dyella]|uniref:virB8 family protein n=1 Tax=unclassified Dyella TaxID=2634549 RepID=UPI000C857209|nr:MULTISPECIES: type IV secretion system protein [unclassified Dyella]MDR3444997.1 type IV secretion system protein [Dyella sp.]PMQ05044.1 Type IV secretion system protein virB8 [Dyella sp. AD56]